MEEKPKHNLLLSEEEAAEIAAKPRARRGRRMRAIGFIVIPAAWRYALQRCDHRDIHSVAWALLEGAGSNYRGEVVRFSREQARQLQVSRRGRMTALRKLEELGLIQLDVHPRTDPAIVLLRTE